MVKRKDLGWGMGARERAQGWALSYILSPYPSSLSLTSGRHSLMPFVSLAKGSQVLHQHPLYGCAILVQVINNL